MASAVCRVKSLGRADKVDPVRERETFRTASLVREGAGPRARTKTIVPVAGDRKMLRAGGDEMATSSLHLTIECRDAPAERPGSRPSRAPLKQPKAVLEQAHLAGDRETLWGGRRGWQLRRCM